MKRRKIGVLLVLAVFSLGILILRRQVLSGMGQYLVVSDPLYESDIIELRSTNQPNTSVLAAELYRRGIARRVVLDRGTFDRTIPELQKYGIDQLQDDETTIGVLRSLGVPATDIELLNGYDSSTFDEARKTARYMRDRNFRRLIVITLNYHSRRTRLAFHRALRGTGLQFSVQSVPSPIFTPEGWWARHADVRTVVFEYEQLLMYWFFHW